MGASIFARVSNAVAASVEVGIGNVERVSRSALSRLSVREMEEAEDQARDERFAAEHRLDELRQSCERHASDATEWARKARFAVDKQRLDLAEQAIGRQIEAEAAAEADTAATKAVEDDILRLTALVDELATERAEMVRAIQKIEVANLRTPPTAATTSTPAYRAERARTRYERMITDTAHITSPAPMPVADEIDAIRKADDIARRLAAMTKPVPPKRQR